ncbi:uncharacterized protein LOC141673191 [Apium graveolens]|uniref:uncharacterized protein LOC141673191 n=1 Tax=Apium graveolens TaxID=4045 RepID=UPI003D7A6C59
MGRDIVTLVSNFFSSGMILEELNRKNVVMIPKKKCPVEVGDLRPISLCNVLAKIVIKVIANRLKRVLDQVGEETMEHILCKCDFANQCWQRIIPQVLCNDDNSIFQWWEKVLEVCDNEKRAEVDNLLIVVES